MGLDKRHEAILVRFEWYNFGEIEEVSYLLLLELKFADVFFRSVRAMGRNGGPSACPNDQGGQVDFLGAASRPWGLLGVSPSHIRHSTTSPTTLITLSGARRTPHQPGCSVCGPSRG